MCDVMVFFFLFQYENAVPAYILYVQQIIKRIMFEMSDLKKKKKIPYLWSSCSQFPHGFPLVS